MAKRKPVSSKPRKVVIVYRAYSDIERDLNRIKCSLACASAAAFRAEDEHDRDLAAQSQTVIHCCVQELARIENELDSWYVSHEHSPKESAHVA